MVNSSSLPHFSFVKSQTHCRFGVFLFFSPVCSHRGEVLSPTGFMTEQFTFRIRKKDLFSHSFCFSLSVPWRSPECSVERPLVIRGTDSLNSEFRLNVCDSCPQLCVCPPHSPDRLLLLLFYCLPYVPLSTTRSLKAFLFCFVFLTHFYSFTHLSELSDDSPPSSVS